MARERAFADFNDIDQQLKESYGAYASYYDTQATPAHVDHYGETPPHEELARLLDVYARPDSRVLDVGCGAGFANVTLVEGNVAVAEGEVCDGP